MADRLTLRLITPEADLLTAECDEVMAPGAVGRFGVRRGHEPFLTTLDAGALVFKDDGKETAYAVIDGFARVLDDVVTVLASEAVPVEEIDVEAEERAIEEARARMEDREPGSDEYRREAAVVRKAAARAAIARK